MGRCKKPNGVKVYPFDSYKLNQPERLDFFKLHTESINAKQGRNPRLLDCRQSIKKSEKFRKPKEFSDFLSNITVSEKVRYRYVRSRL
jgi:hypothetical protein